MSVRRADDFVAENAHGVALLRWVEAPEVGGEVTAVLGVLPVEKGKPVRGYADEFFRVPGKGDVVDEVLCRVCGKVEELVVALAWEAESSVVHLRGVGKTCEALEESGCGHIYLVLGDVVFVGGVDAGV